MVVLGIKYTAADGDSGLRLPRPVNMVSLIWADTIRKTSRSTAFDLMLAMMPRRDRLDNSITQKIGPIALLKSNPALSCFKRRQQAFTQQCIL